MRGISKFIIITFSFLFTLSVKGQSNFEFDYARFYNIADSSIYLELYYSFYKPSLKTVLKDSQNKKEGNLFVKIYDVEKSEIVIEENWKLDIFIEDNLEKKENLMVGVLAFPLDFSLYTVDIVASDLNNPEFDEEVSFDLDCRQLSYGNLSVSDIELASAINTQSQNTESIFYKNSIEVIPNPSLIYGDQNPVIFFYSEIYGLNEENSNKYRVEQRLFNAQNEVVHRKSKIVTGNNSSIVELGAVRANNLVSGIYTLIVSVKDSLNNLTSSSAKRVYVYNKELIDETTTFSEANVKPLDSEFMIMSEEEINYMWETAEYIATTLEKNNWKELKDLDAKRSFMYTFWNNRDNDRADNINKAKNDYYERVKYANQHFGNVSRKDGWKSDRGRVILQYGVPDEIERNINPQSAYSHEIWNYYGLEGGVLFLFVDEERLNIYRLVHSTKRGEIYNQNAYDRIVQENY